MTERERTEAATEGQTIDDFDQVEETETTEVEPQALLGVMGAEEDVAR